MFILNISNISQHHSNLYEAVENVYILVFELPMGFGRRTKLPEWNTATLRFRDTHRKDKKKKEKKNVPALV